MVRSFTYEQIQGAICLLCIANHKCLFTDDKRSKIINAKIPCTFECDDSSEKSYEESDEIIAICKWLYSNTPETDGYFDTDDYFVIDENYYKSLKKNYPP